MPAMRDGIRWKMTRKPSAGSVKMLRRTLMPHFCRRDRGWLGWAGLGMGEGQRRGGKGEPKKERAEKQKGKGKEKEKEKEKKEKDREQV